HSNVVLIGADGRVLDAVKRVGPEINRYRDTLPGKPYVPPPPQENKRVPTALDPAKWRSLRASSPSDTPLETRLLRALAGPSPTLAREIAARSTGTSEAPVEQADPEMLAATVAGIFAPLQEGHWEPTVALDTEGAVVAFAPYRLTQFKDEEIRVESVATISEAIGRYFAARLTGDTYAAARRAVGDILNEARARTEATLHELRRQAVAPEEVERLREAGELLLAYQWQIPRGTREVTLPDAEGQDRTIALDPSLSPLENARAYFRRYEKAKRAGEEI